MAARKTTKYYRDELVKPHNALAMESLIKEVIAKYGGEYKRISLSQRVDYNWNHRVEGFCTNSKGEVLVMVYWQGDSTDGDDYVSFREVLRNGKSVIRAEHEWLGDRTYCRHGDIRVEKEEVESLIKELAKWLSPSEVKQRKINAELAKINKAISLKLGNEYYRNYYNKYNSNGEQYYNGCGAVRQMLDEQGAKLLKMSEEDIFKAVEKVFKANFKTDYQFGKKEMFGKKTIPYDTTI